MSIGTRIRQTVQTVAAWGRSVNDTPARQHLTTAEYHLFASMARSERLHHLRVCADLQQDGYRHPSLLKAALLHDVGKTRYPFRLPSKILVVLVKTFAPGKFRQWAQGDPGSWQRPFVVSEKHPQWGAEMGASIGMDAISLELIRRHQEKLRGQPQTEVERLLHALQAADDRN